MRIVFYRYNSICEEDYIRAFEAAGLEVICITEEMTDKEILPSRRVALIHQALTDCAPLFVFSVNFFPAIAETCEIHHCFYLCHTVDSPVMPLFSESIKCDKNRIFLFDSAQYERLASYSPGHVFHLPLASAVTRYDEVLKTSPADTDRFRNDISFVGSLYIEKNPLHGIEGQLTDYTKGFIDGVLKLQQQVYGMNLLEESFPESVMKELRSLLPSYFFFDRPVEPVDRYIAAHELLGMALAEKERIDTLNALAEHFHVTLYTRSDTGKLRNVDCRGGISTHTEMPWVFRLSRINLNMTIRPIEKGLPLRIFDILGCGGFVMTNYQEELPALFSVGEELEAYGSIDELIDKCDYYLKHEDSREAIARRGYEKVCACCTYPHRIRDMLKTVVS
ncbi:MAG: glycosyltransferase [Lachnospiraceae bacterium]|nr:glycosyltransferase [Lachnospiraceae bacterium]